MKKLIFYFCLLLSSIISVNAQTPNWQWAKSEGGTSSEISTGVCTDASGNVFITGLFFSRTITFGTTTLTNAGSMDIFIVKYDATGNVLWAKSAGGVYGERGQSVCTDASGNVFITGHFYSPTITVGTITLTNTNQTSDSTSDIFIVKYDASGNVLWAKSEGSGSNESGQSVCTDASGNVFITGSFYSDNLYIGTTWLFKSEWDRYNDIFIVKYDTSGNVLWAKSAGGVGYDEGYAVCTDSTGNLFVTGRFNSPTITFGTTSLKCTNSFTDIFIVKYDTSGNVLWAKSAGSTGGHGLSTGVCTDASGNVFITGGFAGSIISFGTTTLKCSDSIADIFIVKYDTSGNVLWAKSAGSIGYDLSYGVCTDASGNVFITGGFAGSIISFGTTTLKCSGSFGDIFIVKYDTSGNVLWAKSAGGYGYDLSYGVCTDASGNVIITGGFGSPTISFGTDMLTNTNNTVNSMDIFIAKLGGITGINDIKNSNIKIYPNPTNNIFNIEGLTKNENNTIQIFDVQGKLVITKTINEKGMIDLSELNKGVYVIKIGDVVQRIVKM